MPIAYAQLLSTRQIGIFPHLAKLQAQLTAPPVAALPETLDSLLETLGDDIVRFK
jgi:hypothetical protein